MMTGSSAPACLFVFKSVLMLSQLVLNLVQWKANSFYLSSRDILAFALPFRYFLFDLAPPQGGLSHLVRYAHGPLLFAIYIYTYIHTHRHASSLS